MTTSDFVRVPAIRVKQPIGEFFAVAIPARKLLEVCYSEPVEAIREGNSYRLEWTQRPLDKKRLREIGQFIGTNEATFPNSIILAANYSRDDGANVDEGLRWFVEDVGSRLELVIPTNQELAPIIDGQHRLLGFVDAPPERLNMLVLCSVFIDLPRPYQAYLFAMVNSTQKSVSRSQTFELFGYNLDDENPKKWSPEKLAVFLGRKLNTDRKSPFFERILIAAEADFAMSAAEAREVGRWMISMATFVDGVTRLISTSPRKDDITLRTGTNQTRENLPSVKNPRSAPLRKLYLAGEDRVLMAAVWNFFDAVIAILGKRLTEDSYLVKTVGIQALFDILRTLAPEALQLKNFSLAWFKMNLDGLHDVDFDHPELREASGQGRTTLRKVVLAAIGKDESPDDETLKLINAVSNRKDN